MHVPVLLEETIAHLAIHTDSVIVDGTFGGGGHSGEILSRYGNTIRKLICVDLDEEAALRFEEKFETNAQATFVHANFRDADAIMNATGEAAVSNVVLDLGTSTFQLLADTRGFSFQSEAPLHMAFDQKHEGFTAYDIVNVWEETSIADIIYFYGEETKARTIARAIVQARKDAPIQTSRDLAAVIEGVVRRSGRIHPATKTFQALRIAVNDELRVVEDAMNNWWQYVVPGGRLLVITFHSLEDRIVKRWMKEKTNERVITKKPIAPEKEELSSNPRSRSAKLRVIEKI